MGKERPRKSTLQGECPKNVQEVLQQLSHTTVRMLRRDGPTAFTVHAEGESRKQRVRIGSMHVCSCKHADCFVDASDLCIHVLFCLVKVLQVPTSNPMVWQVGLNERELDEALQCARVPSSIASAQTQAQVASAGVERHTNEPGVDGVSEGVCKRKSLENEGPCPICFDAMRPSSHILWCRYGCGSNVHARCIRVYADHLVRLMG